jgi:hypothetical protein
MGPAQTRRTGPIDVNQLLVLLLALFGRLSTTTSGLGFGFLLGRVPLGVGFVLLRLALFDDVIATGQSSANLFGLTLEALNYSLNRFLWSALVIAHSSILPLGALSFRSVVANRI